MREHLTKRKQPQQEEKPDTHNIHRNLQLLQYCICTHVTSRRELMLNAEMAPSVDGQTTDKLARVAGGTCSNGVA